MGHIMSRAIVTALLVMTGTASAQGAWVNDPKSVAATLGFQYVPSTAVVLTPDKSVPDRPTTNYIMTLGAEYVPIENLAIDIAVPFDAVRYDGTAKHLPVGKWDDGNFHYTPTDLRVGARYQVLDEPYVALSPYIAVTLPMTNYQTVGFATGGRNLRQVHFGASIGRSLSPILHSLFITAGYEYTLSQHFDANAMTSQINENRSDAEAQLGYIFLDGDLVVNLAGNYRQQHGGIEFENFGSLPIELTNYHDPILKESYIFYGGGASYALSNSITIDAVVRFFLQGSNTRDQTLYGLDLTWRAR
jgi:hypothetical protein